LKDTIEYIFNFIRLILSFVFNSIFRKNFSETLFPIIFAVLVTILSFNTPFVKEKQDKAFEKLDNFSNAILEQTYVPLIKEINNLFIIDSKK